MTDENIELVKSSFAILETGGWEGLLPLVAEDFEVTTPPSLASEPDTYRGHDGIRRYFESFYEAMQGIYFVGNEFTAVGEKVVVDFTLHARGRTTGIEVEQHGFMVWATCDGLATKLEVFAEREEAFAAANPADQI